MCLTRQKRRVSFTKTKLFCVHLELSMAGPRCSGGGTSAEEMHLTLARVVLAAAAGLTRGARRQARADMRKKFGGPTVNFRTSEDTDQLRKQNKRRLSSSYSNIQRFSAIL